MEREKVIDQKAEASKRHDTIVMQLSGTINDTQFQLQEARKLNISNRSISSPGPQKVPPPGRQHL